MQTGWVWSPGEGYPESSLKLDGEALLWETPVHDNRIGPSKAVQSVADFKRYGLEPGVASSLLCPPPHVLSELLTELGFAAPPWPSDDPETERWISLARWGRTEELLAAAPPDLGTPRDNQDLSLLHYAALGQQHPGTVQALLRLGANPNASGRHGVTPLLNALDAPWEAVKLLLAAGADPNQADSRGLKPLIKAAIIPHTPLDVVQRLVEHGARGLETALFDAARCGNRTAVAWLLERGTPAAQRDADGRSILALAQTREIAERTRSRVTVRCLITPCGAVRCGCSRPPAAPELPSTPSTPRATPR